MSRVCEYTPSPIFGGLSTYYNEKLDELKVYHIRTKKPVVHIQQFSKKWKGGTHLTIELLTWISVNYQDCIERAV